MQIEVLTEDKSGSVVLERIITKICAQSEVDANISVRPHRGCGSIPKDPDAKPPKFASSLLDLLPAKCRAYEKVYGESNDLILVVVMDSDNHDPDTLRRTIYDCAQHYAPDIREVVGLCTEEVEAWLLGDRKALLKAYPESDTSVLDKYEQDSICGTWEVLCRAVCPDDCDELIDIGYPAIGHYKSRWADEVSRYMEPEENVSPSFILFSNALTAALKNPVPIVRRHRTGF